jgi:hypothetical protein
LYSAITVCDTDYIVGMRRGALNIEDVSDPVHPMPDFGRNGETVACAFHDPINIVQKLHLPGEDVDRFALVVVVLEAAGVPLLHEEPLDHVVVILLEDLFPSPGLFDS